MVFYWNASSGWCEAERAILVSRRTILPLVSKQTTIHRGGYSVMADADRDVRILLAMTLDMGIHTEFDRLWQSVIHQLHFHTMHYAMPCCNSSSVHDTCYQQFKSSIRCSSPFIDIKGQLSRLYHLYAVLSTFLCEMDVVVRIVQDRCSRDVVDRMHE